MAWGTPGPGLPLEMGFTVDAVTVQVSTGRDGWVRCRGGSGSGQDSVVHCGDGVDGVSLSQHLLATLDRDNVLGRE